MRYDQLEHAIRAACDVAGDSELLIFGSQAILGSFPAAPESLRASIEVDVQAKNRPEMTIFIDGALGEGSRFHATHGFYVHGVSIETATLPEGWFERTVTVSDPVGTQGNMGYCIEAHDLAASKLVAFREKDRLFVITLLKEQLIQAGVLKERVSLLPLEDAAKHRLTRWVAAILDDLASDTPG